VRDYTDVIKKILEKNGALNSMEVCRILNGFKKDSFSKCYPDEFSYETKNERCNKENRGCEVWSLTVYNQLRDMEERGEVKSLRMKWFDRRKGKNKIKTDKFRFWFLDFDQLIKRLLYDLVNLL